MRRIAVLAIACLATACSGVYYDALEKFGYEKRDVLVSRIQAAQESQEDAAEQFSSALEQFSSVVNFDGGDLEDLYDRLADEYEDSRQAAAEVRDRIDRVSDVAEALFDEWSEELDDYEDANLRRRSEEQLRATQRRYARVITAMNAAESRMGPVLERFEDQVLFLKHNLNAQAISSLRGELGMIEADVDRLIADMNRSIAEAEAFIREFSGG